MDKLTRKLGDAAIAFALIQAGYDNPRKIRDASDEDLKKALGNSKAKLDKVRGKLKKDKK